jgi:hypothetical protein
MSPPAAYDCAAVDRLRRLLRSATPDTVPGGVLIWPEPGGLPAGTGGEPALSQPEWEGHYLRLENGALAAGIVTPLATVLAATAPYRPDGRVPVAITRFAYAVAPDDGPEDRLQARETFFAGCLLHDQWGVAVPAYRGRDAEFVVAAEFHLTAPGAPLPDAITLDLGDGRGPQPIDVGGVLRAHYPEASTVTLAISCRYGEEVRTAAFTMALSDRPAAPEPDETWTLHGDNGATGVAYVYRAAGRRTIRCPVIMVEGFPGGHPPDYLYDTLDQQGTATALRAAGRDLVIVGMDDGTDTIQRNAEVVVACIREARRRTDESLVVGGMSMGGLVSRFALTAMEARGESHATDLFITIDTPHAGAYTSLAAQWFVQAYRSVLPALDAQAALLDSPANQQFVLRWLHDGRAQISPLRQAFLAELDRLGGYPRRPRRLAISCGRGDGVAGVPPAAQTLDWSAPPWVSTRLSTLAADGPSTVSEGSWFAGDPPELAPLTVDVGRAWEGAPGGQEPHTGEVAAIAIATGLGTVTHAYDEVCSVPTVSALDLDQDPFAPIPPPGGGGPFDDYIVGADNQPHLTITPQASAWLLAALGAVDSTPQEPAGD